MQLNEFIDQIVEDAAHVAARDLGVTWDTCVLLAATFAATKKKPVESAGALSDEQKQKIESWVASNDFAGVKASALFVFSGCGDSCSRSEAIHTANFLRSLDVLRASSGGNVTFSRKK